MTLSRARIYTSTESYISLQHTSLPLDTPPRISLLILQGSDAFNYWYTHFSHSLYRLITGYAPVNSTLHPLSPFPRDVPVHVPVTVSDDYYIVLLHINVQHGRGVGVRVFMRYTTDAYSLFQAEGRAAGVMQRVFGGSEGDAGRGFGDDLIDKFEAKSFGDDSIDAESFGDDVMDKFEAASFGESIDKFEETSFGIPVQEYQSVSGLDQRPPDSSCILSHSLGSSCTLTSPTRARAYLLIWASEWNGEWPSSVSSPATRVRIRHFERQSRGQHSIWIRYWPFWFMLAVSIVSFLVVGVCGAVYAVYAWVSRVMGWDRGGADAYDDGEREYSGYGTYRYPSALFINVNVQV